MTTLATAGLYPSVTDDDGTGTFGTIWGNAFDALVLTALDDQTHSTTNPTLKPKDITDEVVTARGSVASLTARMNAHSNADGTIITPAGLVTSAQFQSQLGQENLLANEIFLIWPGGDAAVPSYWNLTGTPAIARVGSGQGDATANAGLYAASLTWNASGDQMYQVIVHSGVYGDFNDTLDGLTVGFGGWVNSSIATHARLYVNDGSDNSVSTWHTGGGGWEWLTGTHVISAASTELRAGMDINSAGTAYISAPSALFSDFAPDQWKPARTIYGHVQWSFIGAPLIADDQRRANFARPTLVKDVQGVCVTAPGGGNNFQIDIEHFDGSTWNSLFSSAPNLIATTAIVGRAAVNGTYRYRCVAPLFATTRTNAQLRLNVDAVGSVADVDVTLRGLQYQRPLEAFYAYDDVG